MGLTPKHKIYSPDLGDNPQARTQMSRLAASVEAALNTVEAKVVTLLDGADVDFANLPTKGNVPSASESQPFETGSKYYSPVTYYWPDYYNGEDSKWSKVLRFGGSLGIVILNRNSGEWETFDQDFLTQAKLAKGAGAKRVIFYVKTQYAAAGNPAKWGESIPNATKYSKDFILAQLAYCKNHYGDYFEGVFLDEFINGWGAQAERVAWYKDLVDAIREQYGPGFTIVGNCGSNCTQEVLDLDVDVFMSYEYTAERYLDEDPNAPIHPAHMAEQPGIRFWHVVHDVTRENYRAVFDKAEKLGIGHLYITDGKLVMGAGGQWEPEVNPYANAPSTWIMDLVIPWLKGILDTRLRVEALQSSVSKMLMDIALIKAVISKHHPNENGSWWA